MLYRWSEIGSLDPKNVTCLTFPLFLSTKKNKGSVQKCSSVGRKGTFNPPKFKILNTSPILSTFWKFLHFSCYVKVD